MVSNHVLTQIRPLVGGGKLRGNFGILIEKKRAQQQSSIKKENTEIGEFENSSFSFPDTAVGREAKDWQSSPISREGVHEKNGRNTDHGRH